MGTNYFLVKNGPTTREPIHIGKSSCGWLFHFHVVNEPYNEPPIVWNTYNQVKDTLKQLTVDSNNYVIMNEYDEIVSYNDFIDLVDYKQSDEFNKSNPDNFSNCRNVDGYRFDYEDRWFR